MTRHFSGQVRPHRLGGFTLIELLVVVTVIVILIALLMPGMANTRTMVHRARCASNLFQMGVAGAGYTIDYARVYPPHRDPALNTGKDWHNLLETFGNSKAMSQCPAIAGTQTDFGVKWNWNYDAHYIGYGYNGFFLGLYSHADGYSGHYLTGRVRRWQKTGKVKSPQKLIVFGDSHPKSSGGVDHGVSLTLWWPNINNYTEGVNGRRHRDAGVISYGDGHTEIVQEVEKNRQPAFDGSNVNIEYWDPYQRPN